MALAGCGEEPIAGDDEFQEFEDEGFVAMGPVVAVFIEQGFVDAGQLPGLRPGELQVVAGGMCSRGVVGGAGGGGGGGGRRIQGVRTEKNSAVNRPGGGTKGQVTPGGGEGVWAAWCGVG